MAIRFRQFRLLLWKNFILQIRRPIGTTFEILVPLALISVLIIPRAMMTTTPKTSCFSTPDSKSILSIQKDIQKTSYHDNNMTELALAYFPPGKPVYSLMEKVSKATGVKVVNRSVIYKDKVFTNLDDVVAEVTENKERYLGVIVFDVDEGKALPNTVKYTIRLQYGYGWQTDRTYPRFQDIGPRRYTIYIDQFIPIQSATDMAIMKEKSGITPPPYNLQQLPYPGYKFEDVYVTTLKTFMPLLFTLAFIYSAILMIKEIVFEKQNRLKESMKMMGLSNWVHWLAWYIKCLLFLLISIIFATAIIKGAKIFEFSNTFIVLLFFILYAMSSISYCFFISVFFSNPKMSMLFGCVLWYAAFLPYQVYSLKGDYDKLSRAAKAAMCLLPNSAMGVGSALFVSLESLKIGVTFDTINQPISSDDTFTMAWVLGMMVISSVVFMVLTWYIEAIFPGKYGIPKPFYFPFLKSYWCGFSKIQIESFDENETQELHHGIEDEPTDLEIGVAIRDLRKVFKGSTGSKVAVDGLTLNMYQGQITALLGHNGAGKTTTMSILCGLFPSTSGTAHVAGKNIRTDIDGIRESLGLCPQHNVLFDRLTVKEHLEFFINLKGKYGQAAKEEVMTMIQDLQLLDKINAKSSTLSGGMKRKLSCAIALVGGSETVFLDEPTSGMDPYARRATWDLLLKYKAGKTIILTTHFMDEADFLGDRIAIMADGQLRCCGTSLFLKSRYGVGYHLTLVKKDDFDENATIDAIKRVVPSAEVISNVGTEFELVLNREAANAFEALFLELETKKDEYGIASFGVSVTSMEEVFIKVGEGAEKTVEDSVHRVTDRIVEMQNSEETQLGELLKGFPLKWQQYKAMFIKRLLNSKRDKKAVITQLLLPLVMVLFGLLVITAAFLAEGNDPPRLLTLENLNSGGSNVKAFFADFSQSKTSTFTDVHDYLKTVSVDAMDITHGVSNIVTGNANNSITVKDSHYKYSGPNDDPSNPCCFYQFQILNQKCKSDFSKRSLSVEACSKDDTFGYKHCPKCLLSWGYDSWSCPVPLARTLLNDKNVYFSEYVLEKSNAKDYFNKHVAGFTFGPRPKLIKSSIALNNLSTIKEPATKTTLWYSNQAYHTIADTVNAMSNIMLRQLTGHSNHDIETINYPLPKPSKKKLDNDEGSAIGGFLLSMFLSIGMAFMAASFITFLVYERSSKAKHLQFVSGVDSFCYWFATYTWDYVNYVITAIFVLILIAAFQIDDYKDDLGSAFLLLLLFGLCALPFIYCVSFLFTSPLAAYILTFFILSILSLGMLMAVYMVRMSPEPSYKEAAKIMHYVFLIFPTYALSISFSDMSTNYRYRKTCTRNSQAKAACEHRDQKYTDNVLDWDMPGVGQEVLFMFLESIVLFLLTLLLQMNISIRKSSKGFQDPSYSKMSDTEDQDVFDERTRVDHLTDGQISEEAVVMKNLTKVYRGVNTAAVDHLSLGIPRGECFGLLGVNGAGKTTTFSMLTGDLNITKGTAFLDGYNLQSQLRQVQQRIGYCPQFDALIERMTGREMLLMYARLRGVHPSKIDDVVSSTIEKMDLGKWADKLCGNYSGGNKRKLSTAIAMVGDPPILFLDEPTTGLDPVARRFLWDSLSQALKGGRSIVLTSHSMEECDVLCSRLAIMVNGHFKCLGSPQHLKSRFGHGYTLMIKVKASNDTLPMGQPCAQVNEVGFQPAVEELSQPFSLETEPACITKAKAFVDQTFQGATLMESHSGMLTYQIINENLKWSQIFGHLERNREMLQIVDYSVSQTTLEQVFINFAKEQHSEDKTKVKRRCGCLPC